MKPDPTTRRVSALRWGAKQTIFHARATSDKASLRKILTILSIKSVSHLESYGVTKDGH